MRVFVLMIGMNEELSEIKTIIVGFDNRFGFLAHHRSISLAGLLGLDVSINIVVIERAKVFLQVAYHGSC